MCQSTFLWAMLWFAHSAQGRPSKEKDASITVYTFKLHWATTRRYLLSVIPCGTSGLITSELVPFLSSGIAHTHGSCRTALRVRAIRSKKWAGKYLERWRMPQACWIRRRAATDAPLWLRESCGGTKRLAFSRVVWFLIPSLSPDSLDPLIPDRPLWVLPNNDTPLHATTPRPRTPRYTRFSSKIFG